MEPDGKYVGYHLVDMSNFLEIVMFFLKQIMKKY